MKVFVNKDIRHLFLAIGVLFAGFFATAEFFLWRNDRGLLVGAGLLFFLLFGALFALCVRYFIRQNRLMEDAVTQIYAYLAGDVDARVECDSEGELYRLFHAVNALASVLNAHADNELREKEFLKNTISDISHQLKTPLAVLNIYNGLLQEEAEALPTVREFAVLSEQELDRMETLVQNLLKITKLDAGSIVLEKERETVADLMRDVELHFAYRAKTEQKTIVLSGEDTVFLCCDRDWLMEAIDNIVKNALDHTAAGDTISITWNAYMSAVQITVKDNGSGIHPQDLHHIFKRFYRSRFSQDTQGVGLGLPLAKAIVEAHGGTIEVDSELGAGTVFTLYFLVTANV